jgi:hypothetical protein
MNFYNGQWLIKDFGEPWPSIRFEYVFCIFLLLGYVVTLGIDDGCDMCRCFKCLRNFKKKVLLGERLLLTILDFDINIHHSYKPLVVAIRKFQVATNTFAQVIWNFVNDG